MRQRFIALALVLSTAAGASLAACGGDSKKPSYAKNDDSNSLEPDAGSFVSTTTTSSGTTTTTTATLGDGGDLQGAKLTTSTTKVVETSSDAGAHKSDGGKHDPGRNPEDLMMIVGGHREEARACYDAELKKNPKVSEGTLWIDWKITPDGDVTDIKLNDQHSDIKEQPVVACVIEIIKKIKFAKSPRGFETTTNYKFGFKRNSRPAKVP